jgi:hypothetical protein
MSNFAEVMLRRKSDFCNTFPSETHFHNPYTDLDHVSLEVVERGEGENNASSPAFLTLSLISTKKKQVFLFAFCPIFRTFAVF